jgi:nitronate monooxygenase
MAGTHRPFAVNLLVVEDTPADVGQVEAAQALLSRYRAELGLGPAPAPARHAPSLVEQLAAVTEARVPVFSFAFGVPPAEALGRLRAAGSVLVGTATTVAEARALQGAMVGTMALVPQVVDAVRLPVLAAGGIMDGRGIAAALALGAAGAQMGTAFLACTDRGAPEAYRAAILAATEDATALTRAFSGRAARGIRNRFMTEMAPHEVDLPPYPVQNALTRDIRAEAARQGRAELLSLWAGQGLRLARPTTAAALVATLATETDAALQRLAR